MEEETGDRNEEELIDMTDNMLYNKGCSQKMAQTPMNSQDPQLAGKDHEFMLEAMDRAQKSTSKS